MGVRSKVLLTVVLVGAVGTAFAFQVNNSNLFQGRLTTDIDRNTEESQPEQLPDLETSLVVLQPEEGEEDIRANATITNAGPGAVSGGTPFRYTISINGTEVFSNTDSYTAMAAGDSFTFTYPIPRTIYEYPDQGEIIFAVDADNTIEETNERNNSTSSSYVIQ